MRQFIDRLNVLYFLKEDVSVVVVPVALLRVMASRQLACRPLGHLLLNCFKCMCVAQLIIFPTIIWWIHPSMHGKNISIGWHICFSDTCPVLWVIWFFIYLWIEYQWERITAYEVCSVKNVNKLDSKVCLYKKYFLIITLINLFISHGYYNTRLKTKSRGLFHNTTSNYNYTP